MTHEEIMERLLANGHQVYIVGGAVRDQLLGVQPKDYDLATDATPEQLLELFPGAKAVSATFHDVVYVEDIEVATMREDGPYSNHRRPDYTIPTKDIRKDLARRDFTCNAMALTAGGMLIDPFGGRADLDRRLLRAVGNPIDRIIEHPVRLLRAVRFSAKYGLDIDRNLAGAMFVENGRLRLIPEETVQEELRKGLDVGAADSYIRILFHFGFLLDLLPEVGDIAGVQQNVYHDGKDVLTHTLEAVERAPKGLARLATLLHDIGKAETQAWVSDDYGYSFIGHEKVGAEVADAVCRRLRMTNSDRKLVVAAVREHMAHIEGPKSARKFLGRCGDAETARFVLDVMEADKADRHPLPGSYRQLVEAEITAANATKVTDLAIDGRDVMQVLGVEPGPYVGAVLSELLEVVLDNPAMNNRETLLDCLIQEYL